MTAEHNKPLIRCLVEEAVDPGNPQVLDEVAAGEFAVVAGRWIGPFPDSSPDFRIEIVDLIADGEKAAAHFRCCGTHLGMDGLSADRPPLPPGYSDLFRRNGWRLVTLGTGSSWSSEESVRARGMYLATGLCALRP